MSTIDPRDKRYLKHEMCSKKRLSGAFETGPQLYRPQTRHQPNLLGTSFAEVLARELTFGKPSVVFSYAPDTITQSWPSGPGARKVH